MSWLLVSAQYTLDGTFTGLSGEKVTLTQTFASQHRMIDTSYLNENGSFRFTLKDDLPAGQYRLITQSGIDAFFIFNDEDIQFVVVTDKYGKYVQVIKSVENMIYYDYENLKQKNLLKLDILGPVVAYYPDTDPLYKKVTARAKALRKELTDKSLKLTNDNPGTLAAHFIKLETPVFPPLDMDEKAQQEFMKAHFFDHVDFNDTILLKSSTLNSMLINYLSLYQDRNDDRETFENKLLTGLDTILEKSSVNPDMYASVIDFLLQGFESIGFDKGIDYISEHNQLDEFCENTEKILELQDKLYLINKLAIGKTAPDFSHTDIDGNMIRLSDVQAKKTLLVFWASWCPHCKSIVPEINSLKEKFNDSELKIIGISIDTSLTDLRQVISEYKINWPNIAEFKGWEGAIPEMYGIAATPTMYLLDDQKKIVAKPINKYDLKKALGY
jgi:peroxiredoxin